MRLRVGLVLVPKHVHPAPGVRPHSVSMKAWVVWCQVLHVKLLDLAVQPAYFFKIVLEAMWHDTIIREPGEGRGVHKAGNSVSINNARVFIFSITKYKLREVLQSLHDEGPGVLLQDVVVPCYNKHIHRSVLFRHLIVQSKSMYKVFYAPLRDSNIVNM